MTTENAEGRASTKSTHKINDSTKYIRRCLKCVRGNFNENLLKMEFAQADIAQKAANILKCYLNAVRRVRCFETIVLFDV